MLDTAQRLVERAGGLAVSVENVSLEKVIKESGVSRTSAYREWANKDEFYIDLLCDLAGPNWQGTAAFDEKTILLARSVIAENLGQLASPEGRFLLMREAVRQAAEQNFNTVVSSSQWRSYVALTATALSLQDESTQARVVTALQEAERVFISRMSRFYQDMSLILGFRLRTGVTSFDTLAAVGAAVVEGLALRQILMSDLVQKKLELEGNNGVEEWHLAALGYFGVLEQLIEPEPNYDFTAALANYLKALAEHEAADRGDGD